MPRTALISGISGQDGSYLSELLLGKGYEVHGIVRRNSMPEHQTSRIDHLRDKIALHYGDVTDPVSCNRIVGDVQPDEIYNLAGQSHVRISADMPHFTANVNAIGVLNMLEATRMHAPHARFYQASSSEMFGSSIDGDGYQRITTPMTPVSPYGCAKLYGYHMVRFYRNAYGLHATNGVLFNHESPRRGINFVTAKVVKTAVEIKYGMTDKLHLGNLDAYRDWGHAEDYVRAMWLMLQQESPGDWVVATGETRSVRDLCKLVFEKLGLGRYENFVVQDEKYMRPVELNSLQGDAEKTCLELGWRPTYSFESMIDEIIGKWLRKYSGIIAVGEGK